MVVVLEGRGVGGRRVVRRRGLQGRVEGAEAAGSSRRVGGSSGGGRRQVTRCGRDVLLAAAQSREGSEGIGGVEGGGVGVAGGRLAALGAGGLVVEEVVDAGHCEGAKRLRASFRWLRQHEAWRAGSGEADDDRRS